jgi:hypothetical protein
MALMFFASCLIHTSGASFSLSSHNPSNAAATGAFQVLNSKPGDYVLNVSNLRPGQTTAAGTLTLTNQGDYTAAVTMKNAGITDPAGVSTVLTLRIADGTGLVWNGNMSDFDSFSFADLSPSSNRNYTFTVTFPQGAATPDLQGATASMVLSVVGVAK